MISFEAPLLSAMYMALLYLWLNLMNSLPPEKIEPRLAKRKTWKKVDSGMMKALSIRSSEPTTVMSPMATWDIVLLAKYRAWIYNEVFDTPATLDYLEVWG
jgi:hypothetical protein